MDADFKGELYGAYIYIEKVEFPYRNLPALKKIKVPSFLTNHFWAQNSQIWLNAMKWNRVEKSAKDAVLVSWKQPRDLPTRCFTRAHFGSLSSRFSSRVFYPRSSHIFIHLKIFPWCTLVTWSRLRKPRSKLRYLGVTFETLKIPGEPRNGGDCTMDNNLRGLRSNSTIVIQNITGKMQLGRQTFRIKSINEF